MPELFVQLVPGCSKAQRASSCRLLSSFSSSRPSRLQEERENAQNEIIARNLFITLLRKPPVLPGASTGLGQALNTYYIRYSRISTKKFIPNLRRYNPGSVDILASHSRDSYAGRTIAEYPGTGSQIYPSGYGFLV